MRVMHARLAGGAAAVVAAVLAGVSLRPTKQAQASAARQASVEVRTEVIHRTIRIVRHERGPAARAARGGGGRVRLVAAGGPSGVARTRASRWHHGSSSHAASAAGGAAVTRTSSTRHDTAVAHTAGSHAVGSSGAVTTRTSKHHRTAASSGRASHGIGGAVSTRTSGSAPTVGDDGGSSGNNDD
jgi:hypothetical protein